LDGENPARFGGIQMHPEWTDVVIVGAVWMALGWMLGYMMGKRN